jgi:phosphatidate cytidylyltransferase
MSVLSKRILSAIFLFLIFLYSFFNQNYIYFLFLVSIIVFLALYELDGLSVNNKFAKAIYWLFSIFVYFLIILNYESTISIIYFCLFFWVFISPLALYKKQIIFTSAKFIVYPLIIMGLFFSVFYLFINNKSLLLFSFFIVWLSDIAAYFVGKKFGKKKLAPYISPGKTLEGIYGAFLANFVFVGFLATLNPNNFYNYLIMVIIVVPLSIYGDLFESLIKRSAGKKDSGVFLPGHGGVMDRIDSLCVVLPVMTFLNMQGFNL